MMLGRVPFSQWEADLVIYPSDEFGNVTDASPVWIGGTANKSNFQDGYKAEDASKSGVPVPNMEQLEEQHTIELENVWMARVTAGPLVSTPSMPRNQYYAVVIIWTDREETGVWVKRAYAGVKLAQLSMGTDTEAFLQKVKIEGGIMQQTCGVLSEGMPSEEPTILGVVRYVSPTEQVDLYTYDFLNPQSGFQAINPGMLAGRAAIESAGGGVSISVGGAVAMEIDPEGNVAVNGITSIGGSYVEDQSAPRLEFCAGLTRIASLSALGELGIPGFFETDEDPEQSGACYLPGFWLGAGETWLATIARNGLYAAGLADNLS
jgi:hypothetical protein